MRRIVLDTSVVVAGLRTQLGAGNAVLRLVATRRLVALATPPLFLEYEDVLKRSEHRLAHGLNDCISAPSVVADDVSHEMCVP